MNQSSPTLYYAHDPMCSFCWAFRPVWQSVRDRLGDDVNIVSVLGGLAPDSAEPMSEAMQHKLMATWRYIEQNIPATQFNHSYWTQCEPRRSTYPACRAALIARNHDPDLEDKITLEIQKAYYLGAQNPSDADTLIQAATNVGLEPQAFAAALASEATESLFMQELALARSLGLNSFPGILMHNSTNAVSVPIEYNDAEIMLQRIQDAMAKLS